jgi:hypothetical protein
MFHATKKGIRMRIAALIMATLIATPAHAQSNGCDGLEGPELVACEREAPPRRAGATVERAAPAVERPASTATDEQPFMPVIGMTFAQASATGLLSTYTPKMVSRTTTARGVLEQWECAGNYLYFNNGILTGIQE